MTIKQVIEKAIRGYGKRDRKMAFQPWAVAYVSNYPGIQATEEEILAVVSCERWKRMNHGHSFHFEDRYQPKHVYGWNSIWSAKANQADRAAYDAAKAQRNAFRHHDPAAPYFEQEYERQMKRRAHCVSLSHTYFGRPDYYEILRRR